MSFSNPLVSQTQVGNGVDDTILVAFYYTNSSQIDVSSVDDLGDPVVLPYSVDDALFPASVIFDDPIPVDYQVTIFRSTPLGQPSVFAPGPFPASAVEATFDILAQQIQENNDLIVNGGTFDPSLYYTKVEVDALIAGVMSGFTPIVTVTNATANPGELRILSGAGAVQITLPAASDGDQIAVKVGTDFANKTVVGTFFDESSPITFTSDGQSITFVYAAAAWYII